MIRQRIYWVKNRTRIRNRIHRIVERQRDLSLPQVKNLFGKKGLSALKKAKLPSPDEMLLRQNVQMLEDLNRLIAEEEAQIKAAEQIDEVVWVLESIPGVGLIIASIIATEIDGIERFRSAQKLCAYVGLVPSAYSSGGQDLLPAYRQTGHGGMLKGCNQWLRWALIEAACVAGGCSAYFGGLYRAQRARGKKANTAIRIVARRLCRLVYELLKEKRLYEERPYRGISPSRSHQGLTESGLGGWR